MEFRQVILSWPLSTAHNFDIFSVFLCVLHLWKCRRHYKRRPSRLALNEKYGRRAFNWLACRSHTLNGGWLLRLYFSPSLTVTFIPFLFSHCPRLQSFFGCAYFRQEDNAQYFYLSQIITVRIQRDYIYALIVLMFLRLFDFQMCVNQPNDLSYMIFLLSCLLFFRFGIQIFVLALCINFSVCNIRSKKGTKEEK